MRITRHYCNLALLWGLVSNSAWAGSSADPILPSESEAGTRYETEYPAIGYGKVRPRERIAVLQADLDRGDSVLQFDSDTGYLAAVLDALDIDTSSQLLVFSRTSVNKSHISPSRPRAIYFNDDAYVAWVPGSGMLEIASMDPALGQVFFIFEQREQKRPQFDRQTVQCLRCHDSLTMTGGGVPRFILGSGYVDTRGNLVSHEGWVLTNPATPHRFRWGGWYVTGSHGSLKHLGNIVVTDPASLSDLDRLRVYDRESLDGVIGEGLYPAMHSDIVALLVIEHQVHVQNLITRVSYDARTAIARDRQAQKNYDNGNEISVSAATEAIIERAAEPLAKALLFAGEAALASPVRGSTEFARKFEQRGPFDSEGRSLRQFDLRTRTFRYPLSYLVYSEAFDALPDIARHFIYRRFKELLQGDGEIAGLPPLQAEERAMMLDILRATKPSFAAWEASNGVARTRR